MFLSRHFCVSPPKKFNNNDDKRERLMSASKCNELIEIIEHTRNWIGGMPEHQIKSLEEKTKQPNPMHDLDKAKQIACQLSPETHSREVDNIYTHLALDLLEGRFLSCTIEGSSDLEESRERALKEAALVLEIPPEDNRIGVVASIQGEHNFPSLSAPDKTVILATAQRIKQG